ncbi:Protein of unknown function [Gryllus bimaculatus]|nr:Protein of unknown function [Gryllus bimaculatus]
MSNFQHSPSPTTAHTQTPIQTCRPRQHHSRVSSSSHGLRLLSDRPCSAFYYLKNATTVNKGPVRHDPVTLTSSAHVQQLKTQSGDVFADGTRYKSTATDACSTSCSRAMHSRKRQFSVHDGRRSSWMTPPGGGAEAGCPEAMYNRKASRRGAAKGGAGRTGRGGRSARAGTEQRGRNGVVVAAFS